MNLNELDCESLNEHFCENVEPVSLLDNQIPELHYLLTEVERHHGRRVHTSKDFEALSDRIEKEIGEMLSASTLKRLWGYVSSNPVPRRSTLDVLSRFVGQKDFEGFSEQIKRMSGVDSTFFSSRCISASELREQDHLVIGWHPNRMVELEYLGNHSFKVVANANSNLMVGDVFEVSSFMIGYPLYVPRILRDGVFTPPYIAGVHEGLTVLEKA